MVPEIFGNDRVTNNSQHSHGQHNNYDRATAPIIPFCVIRMNDPCVYNKNSVPVDYTMGRNQCKQLKKQCNSARICVKM